MPIEWGILGNGVDQVSDTFSRPVVVDGLMQPLPADPGFGMRIDPGVAALPEPRRPGQPDRRPVSATPTGRRSIEGVSHVGIQVADLDARSPSTATCSGSS